VHQKKNQRADVAAIALLALTMSPALVQAQATDNAAPAAAQAQVAGSGKPDAESAQSTDAAAPAESTATAVPPPPMDRNPIEVIVTANRRSQSLSKTPLAITAVTGEKLGGEGITNTQNLTNILPNVQNGPAGFSIRGVASGDFTEKGDPSTAFNLDGVYIARVTAQSLALFDIERVEVLRGPQGTLYGRNATAGVVNVITARPSDDFDASGTVEVGNYDTVRTTAMVNVPLSESVAFRLSGAINRHDGYTATRDGSNRLDDQDDAALRARLRLKTGEKSDLLVTADYGKVDQTGVAGVAQPRVFSMNDDHSLRYQNPGKDNFNYFKAAGTAVEYNADLGFAKLTYLFGYRKSKWRTLTTKGDAVADIMNVQDHSQDSHELRLASQGSGPLQYVAGLYYFHEDTETSPSLDITGVGQLAFDLHAKGRSYAPFSQVTYSLSPALRLTGGARYTWDQKSRVGTFRFGNFDPTPYDADYKASKATWKVGAEYDLSPTLLTYASVATGYKAGGFNDGNPQTQPALYYGPETLTSYEGGIKGTLLNRSLYFSASAFYYDYKGLQLGTVLPEGGQVTSNAGVSNVKGFELEGSWKALRDTTLNYSIAVLDAKYDEYLPKGAGGPSYAGLSLDRSPKLSGRIGIQQNFPLSNGGRISATAAVKYSGSYMVSDFSGPIQYRQKSYTRTDVTLGYHSPDGNWFVQAFGRNLENERQLGLVEFGAFTLSEPAQYGIRAGFYY
jgi:iron complex outermembrane receptor protein